jgi:hypothetical protein
MAQAPNYNVHNIGRFKNIMNCNIFFLFFIHILIIKRRRSCKKIMRIRNTDHFHNMNSMNMSMTNMSMWPLLLTICMRLGRSSNLKGQCQEIFDLWFFRQSIIPRTQMNTLKYFRIPFRIRWEINENVLISRYAA